VGKFAKGIAMSFRHTDEMIAELLDDPMAAMIMRADRVDREALAVDLRRIACRLEGAESRSAMALPAQPGRARKMPAAAKVRLALCGARCA
jgi:hypothetical protein